MRWQRLLGKRALHFKAWRGDFVRKSLTVISVLSILLSANLSLAGLIPVQRIVGGEDASKADAPFIVSLRKNGQHYCGGSFVNQDWVITAAHCIKLGYVPDEVYAESTTMTKGAETKVIRVLKAIYHPDFDKAKGMTSDVALLKIERFDGAKTIALNTAPITDFEQSMMTTAGWGALDENDYGGSEKLQKVDVPFVDQVTCEQQFQNFRPNPESYLDNTMFCAGYKAGLKDACQGDSGGPIFAKDMITNQPILLGLVSWGYGCARPDLSGVYTNISALSAWIQSTISAN